MNTPQPTADTNSTTIRESVTEADRAFPSYPRIDRYFGAGSVEEARTRVMRCVERGDGPSLVIGAPGMGKTMLLSVLEESLRQRFSVASLASTQLCTRRALLQAVLHGLGQPYSGRDEGEVRLALASYLDNRAECPNGAVLLVDEAQALPSRLLEELRILSNLARGGEPLVRLVLAGSAALEEQFASPALEAFNQRLAARAYLGPLTHAETCQYVRAHVAASGTDPDALFENDAIDAIYSASDGVPRLINQVCDRAILMAGEQCATSIEAGMIQAAWSDLHQLPAPWYTPNPTNEAINTNGVDSKTHTTNDMIEFGSLDSEPQDLEPQQGQPATGGDTASAGDWNADSALADLPAQPAVARQIVVGTADVDEPTETEEDLQVEPPAKVEVPAVMDFSEDCSLPMPTDSDLPQEEFTPQDATPVAAAGDLFGQGFDEEEVVLDRFASLEEVFSPATPTVVNSQDTTFSGLVREVAPEDRFEQLPELQLEELGFDDASVEGSPMAGLDEALYASSNDNQPSVLSLTVEADQDFTTDPIEEEVAQSLNEISESVRREVTNKGCGSCETSCASHAKDTTNDREAEPDILVIEPETVAVTATLPTARRQDYNQLFAKLRQS